MSNKEVELKYRLSNPNIIKDKLMQYGNLVLENEYQKDSYYCPPNRKYSESNPIPEWFRIRQTAREDSINYKYFDTSDNKNSISCTEIELKIESSEKFIKIISYFNFNEVVVVEKIRSSWMYNGIEISIDTIVNLGSFIEFEMKGAFESDQAFVDTCHTTISKLGILTEERICTGYPLLILNSKQK